MRDNAWLRQHIGRNDLRNTDKDQRPGWLAMIRGWKTYTLLLKNGDFSNREIAAIKDFCHARSFDPPYYPGMIREEANRYNRLAQP